jgi:hypothetical protein
VDSPEKVHQRVGALRAALQMELNDVYIWVSFARQALEAARGDQAFLSQKNFRVPSRTKNKKVGRTPSQLSRIAEDAVNRDIFFSVFVYVVAQVEAFISDTLAELLRFDNRRLKTRVKGVDHTSKIEVSDLIDAKSREDLIEEVIRKELVALFYASPALQMEYLQSVAGIKIQEDIVRQWLELKATRDIIVHNSGVANALYVRKAGSLARAKDGESLPMNEGYFGDALANMKSLVGKTASSIQAELKKNAA